MSDPRAIWASGAGTAKQKSIRTIWPDLAAALDGASGTSGKVPGEGEPQPLCVPCKREPAADRIGVLAVTKLPDGTPICGYHVGRIPADQARRLPRVPGWNAGRRSS
jgi:hypothetical protein